MNAKPNPNIDIVIAPRLRDLGGVPIAGTAFGHEAPVQVFSPIFYLHGEAPEIAARADSRIMLLGGAALDGDRIIWWNFVSSDTDRLEAAKTRWKSGGFDIVPGDEAEFIPLPEV
jgi:hypothetical protein